MDLQSISQLWQICEYHHTLRLFPAIFIIPSTGTYAVLVESNSNLPFYSYKINFNSILPSIFGLNLPESPLQVLRGNLVCISQLQTKIIEVQASLFIAVLIKFLKTHTSYSEMFTISLHSKWCSYTYRSAAFYSRIQACKWTYTHRGGWRKADGIMKLLQILTTYEFYLDLNFIQWISTLTWKKPVGFQTKAV